ncbi:hypothetical protein HMPREF3185_00702, partial [Porphyromonas somerae]
SYIALDRFLYSSTYAPIYLYMGLYGTIAQDQLFTACAIVS